MTSQADADYNKRLPKVELHAHLTGSITRPILQEIWEQRVGADPTLRDTLPEPRVVLARQDVGQTIGSFFGHFNTTLYSLISTLPSLTYATRKVLEGFRDDGVIYLELRTTPRGLQGDDTTPEQAIRAIASVISEWNGSTNGEQMRVNLILSIDRAKHDAIQAESIVDLAIKLQRVGLPVVGVDLCGDPHPAIDIIKFSRAFNRAKQSRLGITLHFAEIPSSSSRVELEELLSWKPDRLGHVIHVPLDLRRRILDNNIGVELCLTCNVLAGMLPGEAGLDAHHFAWWWGQRGSVSLGTDDVGVFGSWGSEEYRLAGEHFGLSRKDLVEVSRIAMDKAFGSKGEKARVLGILDSRHVN